MPTPTPKRYRVKSIDIAPPQANFEVDPSGRWCEWSEVEALLLQRAQEIETLKGARACLDSLVRDVRAAMGERYLAIVDEASGDISVNTAFNVALREERQAAADQREALEAHLAARAQEIAELTEENTILHNTCGRHEEHLMRRAQEIEQVKAERDSRSVIQPWACRLPLRMQSTMALSLRGPDNCSKHNTAKELLRQLRSAVLVPAFPGMPDSFMGDQSGYADQRVADAFLDDHDAYPHHWLMHFVHAVEIVGQFHPDDTIRDFWWRLYLALAEAFHMRNESIDELSQRLADPPAEAALVSRAPSEP